MTRTGFRSVGRGFTARLARHKAAPHEIDQQGHRGMTLIELCIVIVILAVLMATGVATLMRARVTSNEAAAIAGLRAIYSAQFAYTAGCGQGFYATSLVVLGAKPPGNPQGYLSEDLGSSLTPARNGYTFALAPGAGGITVSEDCNGNETFTHYYASSAPAVLGQTGTRAFAITQAGTVWEATGAVPPDEPFEPPDRMAQ